MNLFRTLGAVAAIGLASASLSSCLQAPDLPVEPRISENALTVFRRDGPTGPRDSVEIAINFEDGDGDLGLRPEDTTGLYTRRGGNRFNNNYFVQAFYKRRDGVFVPLPLAPLFSYNGRFMYLPEEGARPGPLKGVLRYAIVFSLIDPATAAGTELQFKVSIADRALHESNVITTSSVKL